MVVRARQHQGRPGTPVIPQSWSQAPRVIVGKTMTGRCEIRRPGAVKSSTFNTTTGTYPMTPPAPHFTGPTRVQVLNAQERAQLVGDQPVTTVGYRVVVPLDANLVEVDDVVTVTCTDDNGDPVLVDHELIVRSFAVGSLAWERDLICTDNLG